MLNPAAIGYDAWAMGAASILIGVWTIMLRRRRPNLGAASVSAAFLLTACVSVQVVLRAWLDPAYDGYSFGLLNATHGWQVATAAVCVLALSSIGAWTQLHSNNRAALLLAGAIGLCFFVSLAPPVVRTLFTDPDAFRVQFGTYLIVPGNVAVVPVLALLVGYVTAAVWGAAALFAIGRRGRI